MIPRSGLKMPLWAAAAIGAAAYMVRSLIVRGGDFAPDLPSDAIVLVLFALSLVAIHWIRSRQSADPVDQNPDDK